MNTISDQNAIELLRDLVTTSSVSGHEADAVAMLVDRMHPAVLRLIRDVMRGSKSKQIPVSCCGESAAELDFAVLLIGLGVRTLSVGSYSIPQVKRLVRSVSAEECARIARRALSLESPSDVTAYVRERVRKAMDEIKPFLDAARKEDAALWDDDNDWAGCGFSIYSYVPDGGTHAQYQGELARVLDRLDAWRHRHFFELTAALAQLEGVMPPPRHTRPAISCSSRRFSRAACWRQRPSG